MRFFDHKWPAILLWPFSLLFGIMALLKNFCYDSGILKSCPINSTVISIGNITVGGTGKTPTTLFLAKWLQQRGKSVAVLSRGYGRQSKGTVIVSDGKTILASAFESGDEPQLLARRLPGIPVLVDEDRLRGAKIAEARFSPTVILLDDGFQHRRLHRDLDIVLFKSTPMWGNSFNLPAGPLRESKASLKRADMLWCNFEMAAEELLFLKSFHKPVVQGSLQVDSVHDFSGKILKNWKNKVFAFCGLAQPDAFKKTLQTMNLEIVEFLVFKDHHNYSPKDIARIEQGRRESGADLILTTEKDYVKLETMVADKSNWFYVSIQTILLNPANLTSITQYLK